MDNYAGNFHRVLPKPPLSTSDIIAFVTHSSYLHWYNWREIIFTSEGTVILHSPKEGIVT